MAALKLIMSMPLQLTTSANASKTTGDAWLTPSSISAAKSTWLAWPALGNAIIQHSLQTKMAALKLITSRPIRSKSTWTAWPAVTNGGFH
eukprot:9134354-Karenia_brevis.AAC.1